MGQFFTIHPDNPQPRLIRQAADILRKGGVVVYPTDSCYAIGCRLDDKDAMTQIRRLRGIDESHLFTLVCRDLAEIGRYARVDNRQYRLLRSVTPGSFTFILRATHEVPRRLQHPKRATIGLRVPGHRVVHALLEELGEPIASTSLVLPDEDLPLNDPEEIRERLGRQVDLVLDAGSCGLELTTVVDLSGDDIVVVREGKGALSLLGIGQE